MIFYITLIMTFQLKYSLSNLSKFIRTNLLKLHITECKVQLKFRSIKKMHIWVYTNFAVKAYLQITVTEHFF